MILKNKEKMKGEQKRATDSKKLFISFREPTPGFYKMVHVDFSSLPFPCPNLYFLFTEQNSQTQLLFYRLHTQTESSTNKIRMENYEFKPFSYLTFKSADIKMCSCPEGDIF